MSIIPLYLVYTTNGYERDKIIRIIMPIYNEKPRSLLNAIDIQSFDD